VRLTYDSRHTTGVVLEVWPSNVYELSESLILVHGMRRPEQVVMRTNRLTRCDSGEDINEAE
jgi:hypothetical protein